MENMASREKSPDLSPGSINHVCSEEISKAQGQGAYEALGGGNLCP